MRPQRELPALLAAGLLLSPPAAAAAAAARHTSLCPCFHAILLHSIEQKRTFLQPLQSFSAPPSSGDAARPHV